MPKQANTINPNFAETMFKYGRQRIPQYSCQHPVIPRLYVPEWKTDMKNRNIIIKNASTGGVPHHEHDENLFLEKREQMLYNVENRNRVESKGRFSEKSRVIGFPMQSVTDKKVCFEEGKDA